MSVCRVFGVVFGGVFFAFSAAAETGPVELIAGTGEGRLGQYVTIPVNLVTNGAAPATIYFDLTFDPSALSIDSDDIQAGPAVLDVDDSVYLRIPASHGKVCIGITGPGVRIDDGVLVNLTFRLISPYSGRFPIEFSYTSVTDLDSYQELPTVVEDGWIDIDSQPPFDCRGRTGKASSSAASLDGFLPAGLLAVFAYGRRLSRRRDR